MPRSWIVMQAMIVVMVVAGIVVAIVKLVEPSTGFVSVAVTPTSPAEPSIATISVVAPFSSSQGITLSGLPSSIDVTLQKGFASTATTAVTSLCTAARVSAVGCPPASNAGHGELDLTLDGRMHRIPLLLYVGPPAHAHDIASLVMTADPGRVIDTARVLNTPGGGLELVTSPLSYSAQANFDKLQLVLGTQRTAESGGHRTLRALIANAPTCSGQWTAQGTVTFPNGSFSQAIAIPCG
jgi:PKD repeat protein